MFHSKIFDIMDSRKLTKRKKQTGKPSRKKYFEEQNSSIAYLLDDVRETVITESTYKPVSLNVLKRYFLPKGLF